jgi:hypothetical protein
MLEVMKHAMALYGEPEGVLTTRDAGEKALADLEKAIATQTPGTVVAIDFGSVRAISVPFADAFLGKLLTGRVAGYHENHPIVVLDATEDVRATIALALRYRHLVALALGGGRPELLGADEAMERTLNAALELEDWFSVMDLAKRLKLSPQAANNRLRHLIRNGALQRERVNPRNGGREFRYRVPAAA